MTLHINGRFLVQQVSGVQRYARELLGAFDRLLGADPALRRRFGEVVAWMPTVPTKEPLPDWTHIRIAPLGRWVGHAWEQVALPRKARNGFLLSLCGSGPVRCPNQLLVIHDANIWTLPDAFAPGYLALHYRLRPYLAQRVAQLASVSRYSARTLAPYLGVEEGDIAILSNSADHIRTVAPDPSVLNRHWLKRGEFLLTVGNLSANKNVNRLIEALDHLDDPPPLAVAGGTASALAQQDLAERYGVTFLGRVHDGELRALYENARAFVFPSLHEGFGIPPLEAMTLGTPVLSSDKTAMPEVLGSAATYFDPENVGDIARALADHLARPGEQVEAMVRAGLDRAEAFCWDDIAQDLVSLIP